MLRFGIFSTASIVPRFIAAVQDTEGCCVTALASRNLDKAKEKAAAWGVERAYGSYEELLSDPEVDAVYVALISSEHGRWARRALEAGKHVLCEKPFTIDPQEAADLFALAREKGLFVMEAQKAVFLPVMAEIKRRIAAGELGRIRMADFSSSFGAGYNSWFLDLAKGGGPMYSNAGYAVALLQYLFDCPAVKMEGLCTKSSMTAEDQFSAAVLMENGIIGTLKTSVAVPLQNAAYLYGEKGYVEIPDFWKARRAVLHITGKADEILEYPCEHELCYEIRHMADCLAAGLLQSPVMTESVTVNTARLLHGLSEDWQSAGLIG